MGKMEDQGWVAGVSHSAGLEGEGMFEGNLGAGRAKATLRGGRGESCRGWERARGHLVLRGTEIQQICGGVAA